MRRFSFISLVTILSMTSAVHAQQTGDAISDGLAALLGRAQQGTQTDPGPAPLSAGGLVDASNPQAVADLLQQAGYRAAVGVDNVGDPKIDSSAAAVDFSIYFYGCENARNCQSVQFSSGYDLEKGTSFQAMNDWNAAQRFGYAYLDSDSDPFVSMDVNMAFGISPDNFRDSLALWEQVLSDFHTHIDW